MFSFGKARQGKARQTFVESNAAVMFENGHSLLLFIKPQLLVSTDWVLGEIKIYDFSVSSVKDVAQKVDTLYLSPLKVRRILKGHQGKVLCLNWAQDRRHMVSSSQVCDSCWSRFEKFVELGGFNQSIWLVSKNYARDREVYFLSEAIWVCGMIFQMF